MSFSRRVCPHGPCPRPAPRQARRRDGIRASLAACPGQEQTTPVIISTLYRVLHGARSQDRPNKLRALAAPHPGRPPGRPNPGDKLGTDKGMWVWCPIALPKGYHALPRGQAWQARPAVRRMLPPGQRVVGLHQADGTPHNFPCTRSFSDPRRSGGTWQRPTSLTERVRPACPFSGS
jgi:hypothetical protein